MIENEKNISTKLFGLHLRLYKYKSGHSKHCITVNLPHILYIYFACSFLAVVLTIATTSNTSKWENKVPLTNDILKAPLTCCKDIPTGQTRNDLDCAINPKESDSNFKTVSNLS